MNEIPTGSMGEVQVAPLRSMGDFLLESARFKVPNIKELEKWNNRVTCNLLYYQTNYFLMSIIIFAIIGFFTPGKMMIGFLSLTLAIGLFVYGVNNKPALKSFKQSHPFISLLAIFALGYLFVYLFDCVSIFMLSILTPITVMFGHASLRTRNLKNKAMTMMSKLNLQKTPMGLFFDFIGQEFSDFN